MGHFKRFSDNFFVWAEDSYDLFPFGNVNTYCVHVYKDVTLSLVVCNGKEQFYSSPIQSTVV